MSQASFLDLSAASSTPLFRGADVVAFVDTSDTAQSPQGSTVRATLTQFFGAVPVAVVVTAGSVASGTGAVSRADSQFEARHDTKALFSIAINQNPGTTIDTAEGATTAAAFDSAGTRYHVGSMSWGWNVATVNAAIGLARISVCTTAAGPANNEITPLFLYGNNSIIALGSKVSVPITNPTAPTPGYFIIGDGVEATDFYVPINGKAGQAKTFAFQTAGVFRWFVRANNAAETGSNAGSNFEITARADDGSLIDIPIVINRVAGGSITVVRPIVTSSSLRVDGGVGLGGAANSRFGIFIQSAITSNGTSAEGMRINPTLVAAGNGDELKSLLCVSTFTPGAFTGVAAIGAEVNAFSVATFTSPADPIGFKIGVVTGTGATNGYGLKIATPTGATNNYAISTSGGRVQFGSLPTSAAGLATGTLWNNAGVVNVA